MAGDELLPLSHHVTEKHALRRSRSPSPIPSFSSPSLSSSSARFAFIPPLLCRRPFTLLIFITLSTFLLTLSLFSSTHHSSSNQLVLSLNHSEQYDPLWYEKRPSKSPLPPSHPTSELRTKGRHLVNLTIHDGPTLAFRDNLWSDKKYISSWGNAGFTNDFEAYMILIYLGMITDRIPILPAISRSHHVMNSPDIWLGDVFDLAALSDAINHPILEWRDVKANGTKEGEVMKDEVLGCWSPWWLTGPEGHAKDCNAPKDLRLDISYTMAPHWAVLNGGDGVSVWSLAALGFQQGFDRGVEEHSPAPSIFSGTTAEPDMHLLCLDYIFNSGFLWNKDSFESGHSPVWRAVTQHAKFLDQVNSLASRYIKNALGISPGGKLPPFIAIHNRRSDFKYWCHEPLASNLDECLPSLDAFAVRVREMRVELRRLWAKRLGFNESEAELEQGGWVDHVLVTSDEPMWLVDDSGKKQRNPYWEKIDALGWVGVDHDAEETVEKFGNYFPIAIDQAIHAMATGFVGTEVSTMSNMGALRVETWNGGISSYVAWGKLDADAH